MYKLSKRHVRYTNQSASVLIRDADSGPYDKFNSCPHNAVIRVFDETGTVIETHEQTGDFKEPQPALFRSIKKAV
jgi:hypothetical protein